MQDKYLQILRNILPSGDAEVDSAFRCWMTLRELQIQLADEARKALLFYRKWFSNHGSIPTSKPFISWVHTEDPATAKILEQSRKLSPLSYSEFHDLLKLVKVEEEKRDLLDALTEAVQIVSSGKVVRVEQDGKAKPVKLEGPKDGAQYLLNRVFRFLQHSDRPTHITSKETAHLREEYLLREAQPETGLGILTGFESIDLAYRGMQPGDLCLVAGFAGHGKSMMAMNITHTAMVLGYNVLYFTLEMSEDKCLRTLATIHSADRKFADVHPPLRYAAVKNGTLTPSEREFYLDVVLPDLDNPEYGTVWFERPTSIYTIDDIMTRAEVINLQMEVDLVVIDYIGLIEGVRKYQDFKDTLNHTIKLAKQWAMSFDKGRGVPILTPFQTNRHGLESATKNDGVYEISALSHASEAERSADMIVAIYAPDDLRRVNEAKMTYLKFRDAETPPPRTIFADFNSRVFSDMVQDTESTASVLEIPL